VRRTGAAALDCAWVACGRFDAFFEYRPSPWDFAAGALIAAEAGARVTSAGGRPLGLSPTSVVITAPGVYERLLKSRSGRGIDRIRDDEAGGESIFSS